MNIAKYGQEMNVLLTITVTTIVLGFGLSICYGLILETALLLLAVLTGIVAFVIVLTKPVWFLYILSLFIPFSQSVPVIKIAGRNLHIGFDTIVIIIISFGYLTRMMVKKNTIVVLDNSSKWLLVWWLWNLLMLIYTSTHLTGTPRADAIIVFLRWSQYIPVFFIVLNTKVSITQVKKVLWVFTIAALIMSLINIVEYFNIGIDHTLVRGAGLAIKPLFIEGAHINYNINAAYLATVGLLMAPFLILAYNWSRLSKIAIIMILLVSIWTTSSRSGLLALIVGLLYLGLFYFRRGLLFSMITLMPIGLTCLWFIRDDRFVRNLLKLRYIPQALPMLMGADVQAVGLQLNAQGGVHRLFLWGETIRFFTKSPLWGHGFRATRWSKGPAAYFTADNYYLETLADTGLIGLALFIIFVGILYKSSIRLYKLASENVFLRKYSIGYQAVFVGLMFINLFSSMFMSQKIWGIFILLSAIMCNQLQVLRKLKTHSLAKY